MKNFLFLHFYLLNSFTCFSQDPKRVQLVMKDTVENRKDAFIKVSFFPKRGRTFELPKKITFGTLVDLETVIQVKIQKHVQNRFVEYFSNYPPPHSQSFHEDSIEMLEFPYFEISNDLTAIGSLDSGFYRLKVFYNKRPISGEITDPNFVLGSRWHYFYVKQDVDLYGYRLHFDKR